MARPTDTEPGTYIACNFGEQCCEACAARAARVGELYPWLHDACDRRNQLARSAATTDDQLDLFLAPRDPVELAEWRGIADALGLEIRLRSTAFWKSCPQDQERAA